MSADAIHYAIRSMTRAQLGAVILGAGYALPEDRSREALADLVRSLFQDGVVSEAEILAEAA